MNIDTIHKFCKTNNIKSYTINDDYSIDVDGYVFITKRMKRIPIKFNKVMGNFHCSCLGLLTLKNSPIYVGGSFYCNDNLLKSLYDCPKNVVGYFFVYNNPLNSIDGYNNYEDLNYKYLSCDNKEELTKKHKKYCRNIRIKQLFEK
jgi:hypothetical protein